MNTSIPSPADQRFDEHCKRMPKLFDKLLACPERSLTSRKGLNGLKAVYVFFENSTACHVGRTRNLGQRLAGHISNSHYSATYAFRQARIFLGIPVTYRKGEGRAALMEKTDFAEAFNFQRNRVVNMTFRYLQVDDPIDQYLLELYAALQLGTSLAEFETS